jgi:hypothetical protein
MRHIAALATLTVLSAAAHAAPPSPLPPDHPIVGTWRFTVPDSKCVETYNIWPNGTTLVTSNEEVAESNYEISLKPSAKGFYKWVDVTTKDNGKKDCAGQITQAGQTVTNYILLHPGGDIIVVCQDESLNACFGPLVRVPGQGT